MCECSVKVAAALTIRVAQKCPNDTRLRIRLAINDSKSTRHRSSLLMALACHTHTTHRNARGSVDFWYCIWRVNATKSG